MVDADMPRQRKAPRTIWIASEREWKIYDGPKRVRTGIRDSGGAAAAERALQKYLNDKAAGSGAEKLPKGVPLGGISIGALLHFYVSAVIKRSANPVRSTETLATCIQHLTAFWGDLTAEDIDEERLEEYIAARAEKRVVHNGRRGSQGRELSAKRPTARRELGVLKTAIKAAHEGGVLREMRLFSLPPASPPKERWLTRREVAWLLLGTRLPAPKNRKPGDRLNRMSHMRCFVLISLYSGRRKSAVLELGWEPGERGGWADLERGIIDFLASGGTECKKRRGQIAATRCLLAHLERWQRLADQASGPVEFRGKRPKDIRTGFRAACRRAEKLHAEWVKRKGITGRRAKPLDLSNVTPHTLKHTAVTWFFQAGGSLEDAEDYFATSAETLRRVYRKHSPHYQTRARDIMERAGRSDTVQNEAKQGRLGPKRVA